jgi:hypothetical protein
MCHLLSSVVFGRIVIDAFRRSIWVYEAIDWGDQDSWAFW